MGIARGPNIITDGLVFGYDTGYGVSDVFTSTRFYKGKPVDNMATDPIFLNSTAGTFASNAWGGDTGFGEFATNTSPDGGGLMYINNNTSTAAGGGGNYNDLDVNNWTLTNGVTYTRSWWAKSNITQTINGHMLSINGGGNNTYILGGDTDLVAGEWKRVSHTFTYSGTSNLDWRFRSINYNQSKVYIANIQLEVGSNASPFTATSRSDTASLIDLKRTNDIDVSNISFDSTGQPFLDGTDDEIDITFPTLSSTHGSIEVIAARKDTTTNSFIFGALGASTNRYYLRHAGSTSYDACRGNPLANASFGVLTQDKLYHLVMTWDASTVYAYTNGVFSASSSYTNPGSDITSGNIGQGSGNHVNADLPVFKIHNKTLTAAEIKSNYNAYKNRFNL